MAIELQNAKGVRDFSADEKLVRQDLVDSLRDLFELYGFVPIETPLIERFDVLSSKYEVGAEILKEVFRLVDQGERDLCLRYDLTVPLARYVGMNRDLKMPFKRYQIGQVFRDGPIKLGRYREFWQCDCDIVGTNSLLADAQLIEMAQTFFSKIGLSVVIEVNNRKLLDGILEQLDIEKEKHADMISAIDKLKKIGVVGVEVELKEKGMISSQIDELLKILETKGSNKDKIDQLRTILTSPAALEGLKEIEEMLSYVSDQSNVLFTVGLARGFAYYTGNVFEGFLTDDTLLSSSLCGGGRWDNMIGDFLGQEQKIPAVGISFGLEPILEVLKKTGQIELKKSVTQVYVIPIKTQKECLGIVAQFRAAGIKADMDLTARGISKNLDYANSLSIPFVVIVGPKELEQGKFTFKNMATGEETPLSVDEAVKTLLL